MPVEEQAKVLRPLQPAAADGQLGKRSPSARRRQVCPDLRHPRGRFDSRTVHHRGGAKQIGAGQRDLRYLARRMPSGLPTAAVKSGLEAGLDKQIEEAMKHARQVAEPPCLVASIRCVDCGASSAPQSTQLLWADALTNCYKSPLVGAPRHHSGAILWSDHHCLCA